LLKLFSLYRTNWRMVELPDSSIVSKQTALSCTSPWTGTHA